MHACKHTWRYTHAHLCLYICMHIHIHEYVHTLVIYKCTHAHIHIFNKYMDVHIYEDRGGHACLYMNACIHTCIYRAMCEYMMWACVYFRKPNPARSFHLVSLFVYTTTLLCMLHRWGIWGSRSLSFLPTFKQLVSYETEIQTKSWKTRKPIPF